MIRHTITKLVSVTALGAAISAGLPAALAEAKELKLASFIPSQHPLHVRVFDALAKSVAKDSNNDLTIKIFAAGALGKGPVQQYKRAVEGVADITFICHAFHPRVFAKTLLTNQVGKSTDARDATRRLWDIADPYLASDYKRVKNLAMFTVAQAAVISRTKPVRSMADLKGAKIMIPGAAFSPVLRAWGASPVSMPLGEMYNALATGVVDMIVISPSALYRPWRLGEVAKHLSVGLTGLLNPCGLIMNKGSYAALSAAQKQALDKNTGRGISMKAATVFDMWAIDSVKNATKNPKIGVVQFDAGVRKSLYDAAFPVAEKVIAGLEKRGIADARAAYKALNK